MTLIEKQQEFARLVPLLIQQAHQFGFEVTIGECFRPPETALLYEQQGRGTRNSLHVSSLAIDIRLFKDGEYLKRSQDYSQLGEYWESLSTQDINCCWGGRFLRPDGNHFSVAHNGVR